MIQKLIERESLKLQQSIQWCITPTKILTPAETELKNFLFWNRKDKKFKWNKEQKKKTLNMKYTFVYIYMYIYDVCIYISIKEEVY